MKILLIAININKSFTPLALLYLKAVLREDKTLQEKIDAEIKEFTITDNDEFILSKIKKQAPEVVGFSCYVWNIDKILTLCGKIKKISPDTKIVLGGPQVSSVAKNLLEKHRQVDIVIRNEGEVTFRELIRSLLCAKASFAEVQGVTYRGNHEIVENPDRDVISDLDTIPSPHVPDFINLENRGTSFETQRGCVFDCHFCYYGKGFNKVRFFSMERVRKDLSFLLTSNTKSIEVTDPVFNLDIKRAKEICRFIAQHNTNNMPVHIELRMEMLDEELVDLLHEANVTEIGFGLQSLNEKVLGMVNRKTDAEKFEEGLQLLRKYDFKMEVQLILGLPGDTMDSFKKSLEYALSLETEHVTAFRLLALPGTEVWRKAEEFGLSFNDDPPHSIVQSRDFSFEEILYLQKIINSLSLFRKKTTINLLCKELGIKLLDIIESWVVWLDDDKLLLSHYEANKSVQNEKLREFLMDVCRKNGINFNFYDRLLSKEKNVNIDLTGSVAQAGK